MVTLVTHTRIQSVEGAVAKRTHAWSYHRRSEVIVIRAVREPKVGEVPLLLYVPVPDPFAELSKGIFTTVGAQRGANCNLFVFRWRVWWQR